MNKHVSAHKAEQLAVQAAYDRGTADTVAVVVAFFAEHRDTTLTAAELERAFIERLGGDEVEAGEMTNGND